MSGILYIANEFPPMGGSGVQRSLKFVKYLTKLGEELVVVSKKDKFSLQDESMLSEIPSTVPVYRFKAYSFLNKKGILGLLVKALSKLMIPDHEYLWYRKNRNKMERLLEKHEIDTIISSSFPYSSHLLAMYLKRAHPKLIWIADYRDEWTNNPYHLDSYLNRLKMKFEKGIELEVSRSCDFLIANTPIMLENFVRDYPPLKEKSTFIPNGYDEEDFKSIMQEAHTGPFRMTYSGSLYGRRNLDDFFKALARCLEQGDIDLENIEIHILGNIYPELVEAYESEYRLKGKIIQHGYLEHKKALEILVNSDLLVLVIGAGKGSRNFYTGKVFEYMRSQTPILGIVPKDGVAADVIRETGTGLIAEPGEIEDVAEAIRYIYRKKRAKEKWSIDHKALSRYEREHQAKELKTIIDCLRQDRGLRLGDKNERVEI